MWVGNEMKSSVWVSAEMKCAMSSWNDMCHGSIISSEVCTEKESSMIDESSNKNKNFNEGCSNCNEIYDVSIMWNEWKAATKMKFKFESGHSKHSEICDGVSTGTKSSSTSK